MTIVKKIFSLIMVMCIMTASVSVVSFASENDISVISAYKEILCSTADEVNSAGISENGIYQPAIGAWARFENVDFGTGDVKEFILNYATPDDYAGGTVTVYIDSMDSAPVAHINLASTGGWNKYLYEPVEIRNSEIVGVHAVYLVWGTKRYSGNFNGFLFSQYDKNDVFTGVPRDIAGTKYEEAFKLLTASGIIEKTNDTSYFLNRKLTTEELVKIGARLMNMPYYVANPQELAAAMKVNFEDDADISTAAKIATYVLGYKEIAEVSDDYEKACISLCNKHDILDGVITASGIVTREGALALMYNLAIAQVAEVTGVSDTGINKKLSDETVLGCYHGIYEKEGIITGNSYTNLVGSATASKGYVLIDKKLYKEGDTSASSLLGRNVKFYYTTGSGVDELVYVLEENNKVLILDSEDVSSYSGRVLRYYDEKDKRKTVSFDSGFDLIYNNISKSRYEEALFTDFNGTMTIVDNDSDGKYDVVCIYDAYNLVVDYITNDIIYEKGGNRKLSYLGADIIITDQYGSRLDSEAISALPEGTVLTVAEGTDGNKTVYEIIVARKNVAGVVDMISDDGKLSINGKEYSFSKDVKYSTNTDVTTEDADNTVSVGDGAIIYLNSIGEIVLVHFTPVPKKYGYLIGVEQKTGLDADVMVNLFTSDGQIITASCHRVMKIDSKPYKSYDVMYSTIKNLCGTGTLVNYGITSDGTISSLDFPYDMTSGSPIGKNPEEKENSLHMTHNKTVDTTYTNSAGSFAGTAPIGDTSIVFCIPPSGTEEYYLTSRALDIFRAGSYKFKAYSTDVNNLHCDVYVLDQFKDDAEFFKKINSIGENSGDIICYVVRLSSVYDKEKDAVLTSITYYNKGALTTVYAEDTIMATAPGLAVGDAVRIKSQGDYAMNIQHVFDISLSKTDPESCIMSGASTTYTSTVGARYGTVKKRSGNFFMFNEYPEIYNLGSANIYVYEDSKHGYPISVGTVNDILDSEAGTDGSKMMIATYSGKVVSVLVIR